MTNPEAAAPNEDTQPREGAGFFERTLFDRTLFDRGWRSVQRAFGFEAARPLPDTLEPDLAEGDLETLREAIDECLAERGGEVSARARAAELGAAYLTLSTLGRQRFLELLATAYDVDEGAVDAAVAARASASDPGARRAALQALRNALVPPRVRLLRGFNDLDHGVKFLVDMRADLLDGRRSLPSGYPARGQLEALDADLHGLLGAWFDIGFLELRRITWDTPATVLEKLISYEAVHAMRSWDDLKQRLAPDRRCFGYFHPSMPDEPLIFVEVALVSGISDNVHTLIDEARAAGDAGTADTAIFYSISNCQRGLAGVSFGNFLIKRVVSLLQRELPNLKQFATLSPIPDFRTWLDALDADTLDAYASDAELDAIGSFAIAEDGGHVLRAALDVEAWWTRPQLAESLQAPLERLCAHFLLDANKDRRRPDRVSRFHLSNGARVERVNWLADLSPRGIEQSAGMMVNYQYRLADIERNHESYTASGQVHASNPVAKLSRARVKRSPASPA